jgi:hypothetical protein
LLNEHKFEFWKEFQKFVKIISSSGVIYMVLSWSGFLFWVHPKKREILPLPWACGSELAPIHLNLPHCCFTSNVKIIVLTHGQFLVMHRNIFT